jgi:hypothetical protein
VARLVLLVIGVGEEDRREPVEGQHAVGLGILDAGTVTGGSQLVVVGAVAQGPGRLSSQQLLIQPEEQRPQPAPFSCRV